MTTVKYPEVWDLDVFFPGGSSSPELKAHIENLTTLFESLKENVIGSYGITEELLNKLKFIS